MIQAIVLLRAFYGNHIAQILDHADLSPDAAGVGTDSTDFSIRYIMALLAKTNVLAHVANGARKFRYLVFFLL